MTAARYYAVPDPLTDRQRDVLRFIVRYQSEHGFSPSYREIGAACECGSTNAVNDHLKYIEKKGWIRRHPRIPRSIVIIEEPA